MYRFAFRPKWILSHLFVIGLVVLMVNLGFWQLRRLDQRKAFNDAVRASLAEGPITPSAGVAPKEWERVTLQGTFRPNTDVFVANRAQGNEAGFWVLSAFDTAQGTVVVDRGFVARSLVAQGSMAESVAPTGQVEFIGTVQKSRHGVFATSIGESGVIEMSQVDVAKLSERWATPLVDYWVHAAPAQGKLLTAVNDPELNNGPHLSYAVQWFTFSTIAVIGYPLILRRNARSRRDEALADAAGDDPDDEPGDEPAGGHDDGVGVGIGSVEQAND